MTNLDLLKKAIISHEIQDVEKWKLSLSKRKKEELEFHDFFRNIELRKTLSKRDRKKFFGNSKLLDDSAFTDCKMYFSKDVLKNNISQLSDIYFHQRIKDSVKNKVVLDFACGFGREAILAAQYGAEVVVGIDSSPQSVEESLRLASELGVKDQTRFLVADCEHTAFPSHSFDVILCARMLHHIDLEAGLKELNRLLKPGGKVLCFEALGYNPILNLYRKLTPQMRTEWEKNHILTLTDLKMAQRYFKVQNIRYWHILSILGKLYKPILPLANWIDYYILTRIPGIKQLSWGFTFELHA